jgi:hypothetical protein
MRRFNAYFDAKLKKNIRYVYCNYQNYYKRVSFFGCVRRGLVHAYRTSSFRLLMDGHK